MSDDYGTNRFRLGRVVRLGVLTVHYLKITKFGDSQNIKQYCRDPSIILYITSIANNRIGPVKTLTFPRDTNSYGHVSSIYLNKNFLSCVPVS